MGIYYRASHHCDINGIFNKSCWKKIKLDSYLMPRIRLNSKCINDLNLKRNETTKVPKENMDEFLYNLGVGEGLFNYDSKSGRHF